MLPSTFVAIILGGWSSFHLVYNFLSTNSYTAPVSERCLTKYNVFITPFQIKWYTQRWNRVITKFGRVWNLKLWFDLGVLFGVIAMVASVFLLIHTLFTSIQDLPIFRAKSQLASPQVLAVIVPGINLPIKDVGYLLGAVLVSAVLHELGHALAAASEGVKINGFGMFMFVIYPGAFVDLNSDDLNRANTRKQLRIYCAGVWHNFVIAIVTCGLILMLPYLLVPLYTNSGQGVVVTSHEQNSPLLGEKGLHLGDRIAALGQCTISNSDDWLHCLNLTIYTKQAGSCISKSKLQSLALHTEQGKSLPNVDCCGPNPPPTHLCYTYVSNENEQRFACLPGRTIMSGAVCTHNAACSNLVSNDVLCVTPYLGASSKFVKIVATAGSNRSTKKHVLYLGDPIDLLHFLTVSEYEGRFSWVPLRLPAIFLKFLQYMFSMSGALALLNIVPCYALDGQWAFKTLVDHFYGNQANKQATKDQICAVVLVFGTLLIAANILFGFAHILTR